MRERFDVVVIGAGASGVLCAVHLRARAPALRVALLDAGARAARGLAYGTPYGAHLLNVPAAKMSARADEPDHFLSWLRAKHPAATGADFAPRRLYGEYLADVLDEASENTTPGSPASLERIPGTAVGLTRQFDGQFDGWCVHFPDGRAVTAQAVILALGNLPPADPFPSSAAAPRRYLRDPWAPGAAQGLLPDDPILVIGTSLTMIDLVLSLRVEGHRGVIHALSRHGRLPKAHADVPRRSISAPPVASPRSVARWLRGELAAAAAEGHDWRTVIDGLRPHTQAIWRGWSAFERGSFLRHARGLWDIHRHRAAPEVASQIAAQLESGSLRIHRGRLRAMQEDALGVDVVFASQAGREETLRVARVINCTGPSSNYETVDLPLVVQARRAGWLVPDTAALGVVTDGAGRLLASDGAPVSGLFTIGPLCRPALWESTAIPEIREQAAALAVLLGDEVAARAAR
ncbi:MAG: FAD/NAD(P)-binding protein [Thermoanaerobaculia bacterium]